MFPLESLNKGTEIIEKLIKILVLLLTPVLLFASHVIIAEFMDSCYLTLAHIYWIILGALTVIYIIKKGVNGIRFGRSARYFAAIAILVLYSLFSLRFAIDFQTSLNQVVFQLFGAATVFYITVFLKEEGDLKNFLRVMTVCLAITAVIGIYEMYSGNYLFDPSESMLSKVNVYGHKYPCVSFYNTNDLATFFTLFSPFAIFALIDWVGGIAGKICGFALSVLVFMNLLGGRARISFGVIFSLSILILLVCLTVKNYRKFASAALSFILGLPFAELILRLTEIKNGTLFTKIQTITRKDYSVNERLTIMISGLRMSAAHLLTGVGVGNSVPLLPKYAEIRPINLHNTPLEILAEFGIFIFLIYVLMVIFLAVDFYKKSRANSRHGFFSILCLLMLLAFQFESLQPSDALHISVLWVLFGILFAADKLLFNNDIPLENRQFSFKKLFNEECD